MNDAATSSPLGAVKSKMAGSQAPYFVTNASHAMALRDALRNLMDDSQGQSLPVAHLAKIGALLEEARHFLSAATVSLRAITAGVDGVDAITVFEAGSYSGAEITLAAAMEMIGQPVPGEFPDDLDAMTVNQVNEVADQLEVANQVGMLLAA